MKKFLYGILFCGIVGCSNQVIEKPEKFISQDKMEEILYEISILNAAKNVDYQVFEKKIVAVDKIIYQDNNIDSLQLVQNIIYYASLPDVLHQMISRIDNRIKKEDSLLIIQQKKQDSLSIREIQLDSEMTELLNAQQ